MVLEVAEELQLLAMTVKVTLELMEVAEAKANLEQQQMEVAVEQLTDIILQLE